MKQHTTTKRKDAPKAGTKVAQVLEYLQGGYLLDLPKAISIWGYIRLSVAVEALRKYGYDIRTLSVTGPTGTTLTFYKLFPKMADGTKVRVKRIEGVNPKYYGVEGVIVEDSGNFDGWAKFRVTSHPDHSIIDYPLGLVLKRASLEVI